MPDRSRLLGRAGLLWEAPLALASLVSFLAYRRLMRFLVVRHFRKAGAEASIWRPLSAKTLEKPIALPLLMASAPRWNTHAIVSTVGPLPVTRAIGLDSSVARRSAASWTAVIYTFPDFRTVAHVGSLDLPVDRSEVVIDLEPGDYWIGLRYYEWGDKVVLPPVTVDGREVVAAEPVPSDVNDFYNDLASRSNLAYAFLHFHAFEALKYQAHLPRSLIDRIVLPVGNPETRFEHGVLPRGRSLHIERSGGAGEVDLTFYTPSSFPVSWCRLQDSDYSSPPAESDRMYLLRIHRTHDSAGGEIRVEVI